MVGASTRAEPPTSATLYALGSLPGSEYSQAYHLSRDGSTVVGISPVNFGNMRAFKWRLDTGMQQLGLPGDYTGPVAMAVSGDGSIVSGNAYVPFNTNYRNAIRWVGGVPQALEAPTIISSDAWAMNADGSVMTGFRGETAYRWTQAGGLQDIGTLPAHGDSRGFGISDNGNVIVGQSGLDAFRWTPAGMQQLPRLGTASYARANAVSGNGLVSVGASAHRVVRWVGTAAPEMLFWSGGIDAEALGVDFDGDSIVGRTSLASGPTVAFLWTPELGFKDLNTWLPTLGVNLSDWQLIEARSISADGLTIAGYGYRTIPGVGQRQEAWVVQIPSPSTLAVPIISFTYIRRRRR